MKNKSAVFLTAALVVGTLVVLCRDGASRITPADSIVKPNDIGVSTSSPAAAGVAANSLPSQTNQTPTVRGTLPYVLTSVKPFDKPLRLAAEAMGAKTVCLLSRETVLVEATPEARVRLGSDRRFSEVSEYAPTSKVQPALAAEIAGGADAVDVSIVSLAEADRQIVQTCLETGGGKMLEGCINEGDTLRARLPAALVATLAARGDVRWMEKFVRPQLMNDIAVDPETMNVRAVWNAHGLTGAGQNISTSDSGIDSGDPATLHEDLRDRVLEMKVVSGCWEKDVNGHGTHTAGSIVGNGTKSDGKIRGTAYGAHLYAWFCGGKDGYIYTPSTMDSLYRNGGEWSASIHSASWGTKTDSQYTSACAEHDRYVWKNPEFLPVFSAGNEGDDGSETIGAPGSAKNVLTVGATQNKRKDHDGGWGNGDPKKTATFSSRGPCQDGRIKPDIAAPGVGILSTRSYGVDYSYGNYDDYYAYDSGTSMSCPLTAGAVALVRQWLIDKMGFEDADGKRPTAALMKAVVTGGAKGVVNPNMNQGWGCVDLEETLFPSNRAVKLVDRIPFAAGEVFEYLIETTNDAPFDVQLAWVDYPGSASGSQSTPRLVNDLDLTVEPFDGAGDVMLGNGGKVADTVNNMESVRIASAEPNKYLITVTCKKVLYDYDDGGAAALYIRGAFDPEATPAGLDRVRIRRDPGTTYTSLDKALANVQKDDTVEVLRPVQLKRPVTLAVPCTIVATNADPLASLVTRANGAAITLASGADLALTNLVFVSDDDSTAVSSSSGSRLILSGTVGVGTVAVEDAEGVLFRAPLAFAGDRLSVSAPNGFSIDAAFGHWTGDYPSASNAASRVVNLLNEDLGGIAEKMTGRLVWGVVPCAPEDAKCVVEGAGIAKTYCRTFSQALQVALRQDSVLTLRRPAEMASLVTLAYDLTLTGDGGSLAFSADAPTAGFVVPSGTGLVLSNLVVSGAGVALEDCAFKVTGGALTLEDGATLRSLSNRYQYEGKPWGGAVVVTSGTVTMKSGARIADCTAHEGALGGGALYLGGKAATANLFGGTIAGCSAVNGGAVYAWGSSTTGACVNIKGDFVAKDNTKLDGVEPSNVFLCYNAILTIPDHLVPAGSRRTVGLAFGRMNGKADKNAEGQTFTALQEGELAGDTEATARHLFSDLDAELLGEYTSLDDPDRYGFKWAKIGVTPPTEPFEGANVWIARDADTKYHYRDLNEALADLSWESPSYVFNITGDIMLTNDVVISKNVVLQRDPSSYDPIVLRTNDAMYRVVTGGTLSIANIAVWGASWYHYGEWGSDSTVGLISVRGGNLTLDEGADVGLVWGTDSRASNAITVCDGGTLTMNPGAYVSESYNVYSNLSDATGCGGAILLDRATACLRGGEIAYSAAFRGGAVCVANGSTLRVGGSCVVTNNTDLTGENPDNIIVSRNSQLIVDEAFTGSIGYNEGIAGDTNWFGTVTWDWPSVEVLTNSAARFVHDKSGAHGVAVTNGTDKTAVLVWSDWISRAGRYVSPDGEVYRICLAPGQTVVVPTEFSVAPKTTSDGRRILALDGGVEGCWYTVYSTTDLSQPFTAVTSVQLKPGETFEFEVDTSSASRFYKVVGEEGLK